MTTQDIRGDGYEGSRHRSKRAAPPRYWVKKREVDDRLHVKGWNHCWLMGWRDITNATNERTMIATVFPMVGVTNSLPLFFISDDKSHLAGVLIGNFSSLILDFYAKHKVGGTHLNFFIVEQLALLPPTAYSQANLDFIIPRVLELTYTGEAMRPFAEELSYDGPPFIWNTDRRAVIRTELDAHYAYLYGLTRDELRYILDPADVMGPDYPSETFRVLKERETAQCGEYRTQRLVLQAWDQLVAGDLR